MTKRLGLTILVRMKNSRSISFICTLIPEYSSKLYFITVPHKLGTLDAFLVLQRLKDIAPYHLFHLLQFIQRIQGNSHIELYNSSSDQVPYEVPRNINKQKFISLSHPSIFKVIWTPRVCLLNIPLWALFNENIITSVHSFTSMDHFNSQVPKTNLLYIAPTSINPKISRNPLLATHIMCSQKYDHILIFWGLFFSSHPIVVRYKVNSHPYVKTFPKLSTVLHGFFYPLIPQGLWLQNYPAVQGFFQNSSK
jgi:hypothetical protein